MIMYNFFWIHVIFFKDISKYELVNKQHQKLLTLFDWDILNQYLGLVSLKFFI